MKFRPLGPRIVVEPVDALDKTHSGIYLPPTARQNPNIGTVRAVGRGRFTDSGVLIEPSVSVGDLIMFSRMAGSTLDIDGKDYLLLVEDDIIGVMSVE